MANDLRCLISYQTTCSTSCLSTACTTRLLGTQDQTSEISLRSVTNTAVCTTSSTTSFGRHWVLISALCTVGVAFFSSNKDTWKLKRIHIAFGSYFTCITQSLSFSSAILTHHFADLFQTAFHSSGFHISSVRSDGLYLDSFFLSGCLEPLFHCRVTFPCIRMLPLSVSFILMHIPQSHNHRYTVSHDVLHLCVISVFCMSYLVCDVFQDAWWVLSYFGNFCCADASHSETIKATLPHLFLMHRFYSISL